MAPLELITRKACCIGIRAERGVPEANSDHPGRVPEHYLQQKNKLLTKANFHSPELTVWSKLCHVPSAQPAAPAWRNMIF